MATPNKLLSQCSSVCNFKREIDLLYRSRKRKFNIQIR